MQPGGADADQEGDGHDERRDEVGCPVVGQDLTEAMLATYRRELADKIADPERLRRAYGSRFLDKGLHERLKAVCRTACTTLGGDCAFINIIGEHELIFAVVYGDYEGPAPETAESYCQHTIMGGGRPFAVEDGRTEQLVCDLKIVTHGKLYSYLGVPLIDPDGYVVGSLCVTNGDPRPWRPNDVFLLTSLASTALDIAYPGGKDVQA